MKKSESQLDWHRVAAVDALPPGRVMTVTAGAQSMALTHIDGEFTAMDNRCPHQGGPLGEGSIEVGGDGQCWLRCPWHGWDFDPKTGRSPGGHEDSGQRLYPVEVRDDGIYVGLEAEATHATTVTDVMAETMTNWGVTTVFGMVGHSNLGLADALRLQEQKGNLNYYGIRHEGAAAPDAEIQHLLDVVGDSGCAFTRNGKQHTATEAEAHLAMKYDRAGSRVKTAEAFIDRLASESSWTGKPYLIQCGAESVPSRDWLTERLEQYREISREGKE